MTSQRSIILKDTIEYSLHLTFNKNGAVKMTRREGSLKAGERAMRLNVELPRSLFVTPSIRAEVKIPAATNAQGEIDAAVTMIGDELKTVFGGEIIVTVGE